MFCAVLNKSQAADLVAVEMKSIQIVLASARRNYEDDMAVLGSKPLSGRQLEPMKYFTIS